MNPSVCMGLSVDIHQRHLRTRMLDWSCFLIRNEAAASCLTPSESPLIYWAWASFLPHSADDIHLYCAAEFPRGGLFCWRQTGPPEWYQWVLGLQHCHSTLRCGRQRPPEDSGRLPEADAAQEEGKGTQEAPIHIWNGAEQQRYWGRLGWLCKINVRPAMWSQSIPLIGLLRCIIQSFLILTLDGIKDIFKSYINWHSLWRLQHSIFFSQKNPNALVPLLALSIFPTVIFGSLVKCYQNTFCFCKYLR